VRRLWCYREKVRTSGEGKIFSRKNLLKVEQAFDHTNFPHKKTFLTMLPSLWLYKIISKTLSAALEFQTQELGNEIATRCLFKLATSENTQVVV
jgi:hypothetical protein